MVDLSQRKTAAFQSIRFDHACFGCGDDNPIGLHLRFSTTNDGVRAAFTPEPAHQGFDGIVHGGIISTVLDEAMAWATTSAGVWTVTAEMSVRFKHPLSVGESTTVIAEVTENRGRIVATTGELTRDRDGAVVASATATFVRVSDAIAKKWESRYLDDGGTNENSRTEPGAADDRSITRGDPTR